jgi:hypothetical protein
MTYLIRALWALSDVAGQAAIWLINNRQTLDECLVAASWALVLAVYVVIF